MDGAGLVPSLRLSWGNQDRQGQVKRLDSDLSDLH